MFKLGLTGSIGMGKSATARLFAEAGCAVWDADAAVHRLYGPGGAAVAPMAVIFPEAVVDGSVSRPKLKERIDADRGVLMKIEEIVHPLVRADRLAFMETATSDIGVFDIPLLFEGGGGADFDAVACVFVDDDTQRERVMARGSMSPEQFDLIRQKQMPVAEKLALSDYRIETDTIDHARAQVAEIVAKIRGKTQNA